MGECSYTFHDATESASTIWKILPFGPAGLEKPYMEIDRFPASPAAVTVEAPRCGFGDMLRMHQFFVIFFLKIFFLKVTLLTILFHAAGSHEHSDVQGSIFEVFPV